MDIMHHSVDDEISIEVFGLLKVAEQHFYDILFGVEHYE